MTNPARNRVTPRGEVVAVEGRGGWMGNRGRLHEGRGARGIVRNHQTRAWITCVLDEKAYEYGRRLPRPATGSASVLTPPSTIEVLRAGYPVQIDVSAR